MTDPRTAASAGAADLRRVLGLVDAGEVYADSSKSRAALRRLEGAVVALEDFAAGGVNVGDAAAAGQQLRVLLDLVALGDIKADSSRALALAYRLEGAVTALETLAHSKDIQ